MAASPILSNLVLPPPPKNLRDQLTESMSIKLPPPIKPLPPAINQAQFPAAQASMELPSLAQECNTNNTKPPPTFKTSPHTKVLPQEFTKEQLTLQARHLPTKPELPESDFQELAQESTKAELAQEFTKAELVLEYTKAAQAAEAQQFTKQEAPASIKQAHTNPAAQESTNPEHTKQEPTSPINQEPTNPPLTDPQPEPLEPLELLELLAPPVPVNTPLLTDTRRSEID